MDSLGQLLLIDLGSVGVEIRAGRGGGGGGGGAGAGHVAGQRSRDGEAGQAAQARQAGQRPRHARPSASWTHNNRSDQHFQHMSADAVKSVHLIRIQPQRNEEIFIKYLRLHFFTQV